MLLLVGLGAASQVQTRIVGDSIDMRSNTGKAELRLAVVRSLSVPFLFTFIVDGAEASLRPLAARCQWSAGPAISDAGR